MNSREEKRKRLKKQIDKRLECQPEILSDFVKRLPTSRVSEETSIDSYLYHVINFLDYYKKINNLEEIDFSEISLKSVNDYLDHLCTCNKKELSDSYKQVIMSAIKHFIGFLEDENIIKNPFSKKLQIKYHERPIKDVVTLTNDELKEIFYRIDNGYGTDRQKKMNRKFRKRDKAFIMLFWNTGARLSEIVDLNIQDIDLDQQMIYVYMKGKGQYQYEKKFSIETKIALQEWLEERSGWLVDTDAVFISNRLTRITTRTGNNIVKRFSDGFNKKVTPHTFRRTYATNIYKLTENMADVTTALHHKSRTTAELYVPRDNDKIKDINSHMSLSFD